MNQRRRPRRRSNLRTTTLMACVLQTICSVGLLTAADKSTDDQLPQVLTAVLATQSVAWNNADIDGFMAHYWKSERLTFSSGGTTTRGWEATIARYKKRYPTPEKMGHLTFDHLEFTPLGETSALVLGQWHLQRGAEEVGGNFSLVFRRIESRWVIVHDHTSSLATLDN